MLLSCNDPVRIFRELETLGALTVCVDTTRLPAFTALQPETCYLGWELTLQGDVSCDQVSEVFAWVEGDCELLLHPLPSPQSAVPDSAAAAPGHETMVAEALSPDQQPLGRRHGTGDQHAGVEPRWGGDQRSTFLDVDTSSIRVSIDRIDALINTVGELVITQSMLSQLSEGFDLSALDKLRDGLDQLERHTRELQESVMRIRMLPMSFAFNRFPRLVHDLSQQLEKKARLRISGEQTELDKTVLEKIVDPLVHLVRNALDHGIEPPAVRLAAGKPEVGLLHLDAYHQGGSIVIEVSDDGAGLPRQKILGKAAELGLIDTGEALSDEQVYGLVFQPGFSTAETVSEVSGRGVGMDVVRRNITALGGTIEVYSTAGHGTTFTIRLPLTLAILDGQLVRVGQETYIRLTVRPNFEVNPRLR
jgi:two-component system chemotaxis sensor kinase CheA